jgi:hypothetical protein
MFLGHNLHIKDTVGSDEIIAMIQTALGNNGSGAEFDYRVETLFNI